MRASERASESQTLSSRSLPLSLSQVFSVRLRAMALAVGYPVTCSDWWGPMAEKMLADEGLPYELWDRALLQRVCAQIKPTIQLRSGQRKVLASAERR